MTTNTDARRAAPDDGSTERREGTPPTDGSEDGDGDPAIHGARAALYGALGGTFVYPDEETVEDLTAPDALAAVREAADRLGYPREGRAFVETLDRATGEDLRTAHDALFGIPGEGGSYPVVPYEANYTVRDDVGQRQRRIAAVSGLLDQLGIERSEDFDERRDHLAVELEAMQVLAGQHFVAADRDEREDVAGVRDAESTVLSEHLVEFVPAVAEDLSEAVRGHDRTDESWHRGTAVLVAAAELARRLVADDPGRIGATGARTPEDVHAEGGEDR